MKKFKSLCIKARIIQIIFLAVVFGGCSGLSESVHMESAGMNGSFEHLKNGLPANWNLYTPNTVPEGDFDLIIDSTDAKHGSKSLKFVVRECSSDGGYNSPGLSQTFDVDPGKQYRISFWVKNDKSDFIARIGGVTAFTGKYATIIRSENVIKDWEQVVYTYTVEGKYNKVRFDVNILYPGTFWIDDIRFDAVN